MKNKKKSGIIYKSVGFIVFLSIIVVVIILISNFSSGRKLLNNVSSININDTNLGYETFENIKNGTIKVSCNDAKRLGSLFIQINNEISNDDNVSQSQMANYAVSTPAKKEIYDFSTNLISFIENYYINNISQAEAVLQAVNMDIYSNIAQISIMIKTGNITEKEFYDFLNIEYCGVTPPASYISPKDIVIYSINNSYGRGEVEGLLDNSSK
ncbi:MAG: hypothetical protein SPF17_11265 [Candidatus Mucispirillum faecigallinarum]|nr:hypothetical protein [Candidatus Mucispirillum faecigallinarum]